MKYAKSMTSIALNNQAGRMPEVEDWFSDILMYNGFASKFGWTPDVVDNLLLSRLMAFQGIMKAESEKMVRERMKMNRGR